MFAIECDGRLAGCDRPQAGQLGVARNAGYVHNGRVDMVLFSLVPDDLETSGAVASLD